MKEPLVSFKTAMLLKEKGFDYLCQYQYDKDKNLYYCYTSDCRLTNNPTVLTSSLAPTQTLAQKWLREVHKIHIAILPKMLPSNEIKYYIFKGKIKTNWIDLYDTYEEALEKAIKESFKYVK